MLSKVGIYAVLRLWTLCFPASAGASALFGADVLIWGGLATLGFGTIGMMASLQLGRLAAFSIIVSSGTLLAAIGFARATLTGGALFYLASSTLAVAAMFLLVELAERARQAELDPPLADVEGDQLPFFIEAAAAPGTNLDDDEEVLIGRAIPAALAFLGLAFVVCALAIAGLPPLSGFIGKVAMLSALIEAGSDGQRWAGWALFALLIGSAVLSAVALSRIGIRQFWAPQDRPAPRLRVIECVPVAALLGACLLLVVGAGPVLTYTRASAEALHHPAQYIDAVMSARPRPGSRHEQVTP